MKKLFISFTGLLAKMFNGQVSSEDLNHGLFYFGCIRAHGLDPWNCPKPKSDQRGPGSNEVLWFYKDHDAGRLAHGVLKKALRRAEREGRVAWRKKGHENSFQQLSNLLVRNGLQGFTKKTLSREYTYPEVVDAVNREKVPVDVILR